MTFVLLRVDVQRLGLGDYESPARLSRRAVDAPHEDVDGPLAEPCRGHFRRAVVGRTLPNDSTQQVEPFPGLMWQTGGEALLHALGRLHLAANNEPLTGRARSSIAGSRS
jgi:hypothetical protein